MSAIEGSNWRHGDLEDTLLQLFMAAAAAGGRQRKFSAMDVKRVYFGNWLRDYSQAIDTGALKYVEAETVRILLWVLSFMTFGYATGEFEVTAERLGCYRPEEHIDNPKDYADNADAREFDRRLRGPVDEEIELGIDERTGLKNYIANESIRRLSNGEQMYTSAGLVRKLFTRSIELGRRYARDGRKEDLYEAFRLMGTGLHCLEDYSAHSNYTELALIELGESEVFPHVGRETIVNIQGREIWPIVTGTFGGVDFLHSVLGEFNDKAMQSEISQLHQTMADAQATAESADQQSIIKELMGRLNLGGSDNIDSRTSELQNKSAAQKQATEEGNPYGLSPDITALGKEIYPFLEFHDELMKRINEALEKVGLDVIVEKLSEAVSIFVFSLLAPFILPILSQAEQELKQGSSEVIASSEDKQYIVFEDDYSSNPTHSMLSKDHFTNLLNEPAGKVASACIKFAVPLLMEAWDNESRNPNQVCDQIIGAVFHHPAFRNGEDGRPGSEGRRAMFAVVEEWWNSKDSQQQDFLRAALSREGVREGRNHKAGLHDSGHGCCKPLKRNHNGLKGDIGSIVGDQVGVAVENALGKTVAGSDTGIFGQMVGGFVGGFINNNLQSLGGGNQTSYSREESTSYDYGSGERSYQSREEYSYNRGGNDEYVERQTFETPSYERQTDRYGSSGGYEAEQTYESRDSYGRREVVEEESYSRNYGDSDYSTRREFVEEEDSYPNRRTGREDEFVQEREFEREERYEGGGREWEQQEGYGYEERRGGW
ncbi:heterokaryon incompatibility protein Het-C-domain-containing protein [Sphaerosporella brunnea]|uniref:Heterokaryon incompatibility protein Het-C-domain-containing protein n=1 Tax=Sphaerosporella brunnea TaxID=1250544 RepID=A0A5J5EFL7_9PEZI|nr:heterokaryon incompatibility protein Het-C-domain-containing protein [Sphaerosporella brunnea]